MSQIIPPSPVDSPFGSYNWADWYEKVRRAINNSQGVIAVAQGGTGLTSYSTGDTLYASAAGILSKLAIGPAGYIYTSTGTVPSWAQFVPVAHGGTGTATPALVAGTNVTITGTWPNQTINASGGTSGLTVSSQSISYTFVLADANSLIRHPATDTTARNWTIPANSSVAFPVGTMLTIDNEFGAGFLTILITTDTLLLVGVAGGTGTRTLAPGGQATAVKVTTTSWRISGIGLS